MSVEDGELIIVGSGGHARIVIDAAEQAGFLVLGIIDINYKNQAENILGYPVLGGFSELKKYDTKRTSLGMALGDGQQRAQCFHEVERLGFDVKTIIHPTATISKHAHIGKGVLINAGVFVNAGAQIGIDAIVNTAAIVEHEVTIGDHSHVGPGARVAGRVSIGEFTFVGIGATIIEKITIGDRVTIGAGSVVIRNIESNSTVAGVPAKRIQ